MKKTIIYGIKNCNSMKKAFDFLDRKKIEYEFVDFKKSAPSLDFLQSLLQQIPMQSLINTKGTTYKKLKTQGIEEITPEIITNNPSIIKRPLILVYENESKPHIYIGLQEMESLL